MKPICYYVIITLVMCAACKSMRDYIVVETRKSQKNISVDILPQNITTSDKFNWQKSFSYREPYLFSFNSADSTIQILNFKNNEPERTIVCNGKKWLAEAKFGFVNSIYVQSLDSIFVLQDNRIVLMDTTHIYYTAAINPMQPNGDNPIFSWRNLEDFPIYWDNMRKKLLIEQYCSMCNFDNKNFFDTKKEVEYDMTTQKAIAYPQKYSSLYLQDYYGFAIQTMRCTTDSLSIYTFSIDPNIYLYNRFTQKTTIVGGKSEFQTAPCASLSTKHKENIEEKMKHLGTIALYNQLLFDPYKHIYYRFFSKAQPLKNADGTYNTYSDREYVLMVFTENFELMKEVSLGSHRNNPFKSFVTPRGLVVSANYKPDKDKPNLYKYDLINIKYE